MRSTQMGAELSQPLLSSTREGLPPPGGPRQNTLHPTSCTSLNRHTHTLGHKFSITQRIFNLPGEKHFESNISLLA